MRPPLQRSRSDKVIGGVAGGLADYSGIDVVLWRVAFVALALLGGSGVLFYLVLWVLMPAASPNPQTPLDRGVERFRTAVAETATKAMGPRTPRS